MCLKLYAGAAAFAMSLTAARAQIVEFQGMPTPREILEVLAPERTSPATTRSWGGGTPRSLVTPQGQDLTGAAPAARPPQTALSVPRPPRPTASEATGGTPTPRPIGISFATHFAVGSTALTPGLQAMLRGYGAALSMIEDIRVEISGHADASGSAEVNDRLSRLRAEAARDFLVREFRIAPGRVSARGAGSREARADFGPYAPEQRRIVIVRIS